MAEENANSPKPGAKDPPKRYKSVKRDVGDPTPVNWQRKPHVSDEIPWPEDAQIKISEDLASVDFGNGLSCSIGDHFYLDVERNSVIPRTTDLSGVRSFDVVRLVRLKKGSSPEAEVNYLVRPEDVYRRNLDSRELYASYEKKTVPLTKFRGKCTVQVKQAIRNLAKYREKPSQFYVSGFYDHITRKMYDLVPVTAMRSLPHLRVAELRAQAEYAILSPEYSARLCESTKKKRGPAAPTADEENETEGMIQQWPFRYYDHGEAQFMEEGELPTLSADKKVGQDYQVEVDDWTGHHLRYYKLESTRGGPKLRYTDSESEASEEESAPKDVASRKTVDSSLPWVQEMPSGYIVRGNNSTSTPISLPLQGISEFISKCRDSCAKKLDLEPCNQEFLDACCTAYANNMGNEGAALLEVMDLNAKHLGIPELSDSERSTLRQMLSPFLNLTWHDIVRAIDTRTGAEISRYFWARQLKRKRNVAWARQIVTSDEDQEMREHKHCITEYQSKRIRCAACYTDTTYSWEPMPHYLTLLPLEKRSGDLDYAMCLRCARLWYRYSVGWRPEAEVLELMKSEVVEYELVEDAKSFNIQEDKRVKRLENAMNKKQASNLLKLEKQKEKSGDKVERDSGSKHSTPVKETRDDPASKGEEGKSDASEDEADAADDAERSATGDAWEGAKPGAEGESEDTDAAEDVDVGSDDEAGPGGQSSGFKRTDTESHPASKRTKSIDPLSCAAIDAMLETIDEAGEPESGLTGTYTCAVCGQLDPSMAANTCAGCGLSVHVACYGRGVYRHRKPEQQSHIIELKSQEAKVYETKNSSVHMSEPEKLNAILSDHEKAANALSGGHHNKSEANSPTLTETPSLNTDTTSGQIAPTSSQSHGTVAPSEESRGVDSLARGPVPGESATSAILDDHLQSMTYLFDEELEKQSDLFDDAEDQASSSEEDQSEDAESEIWFCDCCSNSRLILNADPFYQCRFCPLFPMSYNEWMAGNVVSHPVDALKQAIDGTWCHLRCSLFIDGVTFLDARDYEDVDPSGVPESVYGGQCVICAESYEGQFDLTSEAAEADSTANSGSPPPGGGSGETSVVPLDAAAHEKEKFETLNSNSCFISFPQTQESGCWKTGAKIQCSMCSDRFHVSCASLRHFKMGFTREMIPKPTVICSKHASCNTPLTPISLVDLSLNLTAMQLYTRTHKVSKRRALFTVSDWSRVIKNRVAQASSSRPIIIPLRDDLDNKLVVCSSCSTRDASCYIFTEENETQCVLCYTQHEFCQEGTHGPERKMLQACTSVVNSLYEKAQAD